MGWNSETAKFADGGRYVVTKDEAERGAFKTPTIRDASKHAPFMHDGSILNLKEVVEHYDKGGNANPTLSPRIKPLNLTDDEIADLVAFIEALECEFYHDSIPLTFPE